MKTTFKKLRTGAYFQFTGEYASRFFARKLSARLYEYQYLARWIPCEVGSINVEVTQCEESDIPK